MSWTEAVVACVGIIVGAVVVLAYLRSIDRLPEDDDE